MANNTPSVKFNNNKVTILAVIGWSIIIVVLFLGTGFILGYQYKAAQDAKTSAAVKDALKAAQPAPAVAAVKN